MSGFVETEDGLIYWPVCPVPLCSNRVCLSLQSDKCFPHTKSSDSFKDMISKLEDQKVTNE